MFYIPEQVQVGGIVYDVQIADRIRDSSSPVGTIYPDDAEILIQRTKNNGVMCQTFLHELIHAIHTDMGYIGDPTIEDERYVDGLANAFYALIQNNPHLFDYIEEDEEEIKEE